MPPRAGNPMALLPPASRQGGNRGRGFRQHRHPRRHPLYHHSPRYFLYVIPSVAEESRQSITSPLSFPRTVTHVIPSVAEESQPPISELPQNSPAVNP